VFILGENIIELKNISKSFSTNTVLDNFTLNIKKNEFLTLLGPSGCGKTTTLKILAGFENADSGEVYFEDKEINNLPPYQRQLNTVFQKYALFPHMNIYENIAFGLKIKKLPKKAIDQKVKEMLKLVALEGFEKRSVDSLSGGQQQRVAIARALVNEPKVLLLDEPLGALDLKLRKEMQLELKNIQKKLGITFVFVTHDQEEALSIADRLVIMKRGRIIETGKPADVYFSPKSLFAENFVGETNLLEGKIVETDEMSCVVDFQGRMLKVPGRSRKQGEKVVVAVRPESIQLAQCAESRTSDWRGRVEQVTFLGSTMRYEIEVADGLKLIAQAPSASEQEFHVGESVDVLMGQGKHMLLFDYPAEGLEKEVALE
jgi:spermidine/putrescine transport system ATP-binding protein